MLRRHLSFERSFQKWCQIFLGNRMLLHHSLDFWLVVAGKHCRTSSRNRVASSAVNTSLDTDDSLFATCCWSSAVWDPMFFYLKTSYFCNKCDCFSTSLRARIFAYHLSFLKHFQKLKHVLRLVPAKRSFCISFSTFILSFRTKNSFPWERASSPARNTADRMHLTQR